MKSRVRKRHPEITSEPKNRRESKMESNRNVNFHTDAAALILAAARKSGLLAEVAEALSFVNKHPNPSFGCAACDILEKLAEEFDDHACTTALVVEGIYGTSF
jgi:hypothetical protein